MLNTKYAFHHLRLVYSSPPLWLWRRLARYRGDIKICYNFISIQLIHKNHMFNITVPAFVSVSFVFPSLRLLCLSALPARNMEILTFCLYSMETRSSSGMKMLKVFTCCWLLLFRLNCFPSPPPKR